MVDEQARREAAIKRIKEKRDFWAHAIVYVFVNAMLVWVWWSGPRAHFWPMWPLWGWGMGLAFHAWETFIPEASEAAIQKQMDKDAS